MVSRSCGPRMGFEAFDVEGSRPGAGSDHARLHSDGSRGRPATRNEDSANKLLVSWRLVSWNRWSSFCDLGTIASSIGRKTSSLKAARARAWRILMCTNGLTAQAFAGRL